MKSLKINVNGSHVAIKSPHGVIAFDHKTTPFQVHHDCRWGVSIGLSGGMKLTLFGDWDFPDSLQSEAIQRIISVDFNRINGVMFDIATNPDIQGEVFSRDYA